MEIASEIGYCNNLLGKNPYLLIGPKMGNNEFMAWNNC